MISVYLLLDCWYMLGMRYTKRLVLLKGANGRNFALVN